MLTPCPTCGNIHDLKQEDAMSPVERDRLCARCYWRVEVLNGRATMEQANSTLVAHGHPPLSQKA
jgi:hypothetical protein